MTKRSTLPFKEEDTAQTGGTAYETNNKITRVSGTMESTTSSSSDRHEVSIISVNLDKRMSTWIKLEEAVSLKRATILAIQDPPSVNSELWGKIVAITSGHHCIIIDANIRSSAFIVDKTRVTIIQTHYPTNAKACCIGMRAKIDGFNQNKETIFLNVYIRPRASAADLEQCLQDMSRHIENSRANRSNSLIMGDFNATSHLWEPIVMELESGQTSDKHYSNIKINRGRRIERFIAENKLWCANSVNKRSSYGTSCIDLVLLGNKLKRKFARIDLVDLGTNAHKATRVRWNGHMGLTCGHDTIAHRPRLTGYKYNKLEPKHFLAINLESQTLLNNLQTSSMRLYLVHRNW